MPARRVAAAPRRSRYDLPRPRDPRRTAGRLGDAWTPVRQHGAEQRAGPPALVGAFDLTGGGVRPVMTDW